MEWLRENLREPLTLSRMAEPVAMSTRTLTRRFLEQTGKSPLQWLGVTTGDCVRAGTPLGRASYASERHFGNPGFKAGESARSSRKGRYVGSLRLASHRTGSTCGAT
ncbi:AraC family transcriptional regulator [Paraburkholderia sp. BL18I3N2]|uniref:AraC family transcriptional regulator n=1 Tax=Paraburkholderia sp. BL18I3N2 TaxID=1938799 RepID=UPI0021591604|nr:AraC family transcriptional regulator [Paraburkholderia sp. BL18I3N2]